MSPPVARAAHAAVAVLALVSLGIDVVVVATTEPEVPASLWARYVELFSFFTIMSTVLVGLTSVLLAVDPTGRGAVLRVLRLDALVCIVLTGAVYHLLLSGVHEPVGVAVLTNVVEHTVLPVLVPLVWLAAGPRPVWGARAVAGSLVVPLAWLGWTFARGVTTGTYPYPFMDAVALGTGPALANTGAVAVGFLVLASAAAAADRLLPGVRPAAPARRPARAP